jgi:hypothetical protein
MAARRCACFEPLAASVPAALQVAVKVALKVAVKPVESNSARPAGSRGNFTKGGRLSIRMALFRRVRKRNYKLEPDRFRQGRTAVLQRPLLPRVLPIRGGAPVKNFHCTQVSHHDLQIDFQGV